jgi:hypothetical protein
MGQPNKGPRHLLQSRVPLALAERVARYAADRGLSISDAVGDLTAQALGEPLPSETLPRPKSRNRQREELSLGMSA